MNIYISNLNFATKDESLRNLFAGYGDVSSANIITTAKPVVREDSASSRCPTKLRAGRLSTL